MRKATAIGKKHRLRVRKAATLEIVTEQLSEGPKHVEQLEEATKVLKPNPSRRTIEYAIEHLMKEKKAKRIGRGVYALSTFISLKEMFRRVEAVGRFYSTHDKFYASIDEFSRDASIPQDYKVKVGEGGATFTDVVFMVARKFGIKIEAAVTKPFAFEYTSPEMEKARRTREKGYSRKRPRKVF